MLSPYGYSIAGFGENPSARYACARTHHFQLHMCRCLRDSAFAVREVERTRELLAEQLHDAFVLERGDSLHVLHACLREILLSRFTHVGRDIECSPTMFYVQQQILHGQLDSDLACVRSAPLPDSEEAFISWFASRSHSDGSAPHPLFTFLERDASLPQFRRFIEIEAGVHIAFDDVLAYAQIGVRGAPRREFLHNLCDETGSPSEDNFHLTMFSRLVHGLYISDIDVHALPWQSLACANYLMFLACFRSFFQYCAGYLGLLEAHTPARFGCILRGGHRLGIESSLLEYHAQHSELDTAHAQGWLNNILLPRIATHGKGAAHAIATGVRLREHVANRYWDAVLDELRAIHCFEVALS